jgi:SAM-dependent methyltransferase
MSLQRRRPLSPIGDEDDREPVAARLPTLRNALIAGGVHRLRGRRAPQAAEPGAHSVEPDVRYDPTPPDVVAAMLRLAGVRPGDVVCDLGCGDGRVAIAAARDHGASAVGIDIDPARIAESTANARAAGVADRVKFVLDDLLEADLRAASVLTLFLSPRLNMRLRPKLLRELPRGARIVSHWHNMGDWRPQRIERVRSEGQERPLHLWVIGPATQ